MKNTIIKLILMISLVFISACNPEKIKKPLMLVNSDTLNLPIESVHFEASGIEWEAQLLSFTQPIPLMIQYTDNGFYLSQKSYSGVVEGPGKICVVFRDNYFYYNVYLKNGFKPAIIESDYRSPKTVNPDSNLTHQKILIAVDEWRNISSTPKGPYLFEEEQISLPGKAGVYRAQESVPLSSYYVQPGSCTSIPLISKFVKNKQIYNVLAGPLKDRYDNLAADGTVVSFIYNDGVYTHIMEAALINGFASIEIPANEFNQYSLFAKVNETRSEKINLKPL